MIIKEWKQQEQNDNPHGVDVRALYNQPEAMINVISFQPGEALKPHVTPVNVVFYVLEGTGVVEVGDEKQEVGKDTLIESPKDIKHCWYNESDAVLRVMVIKVPKPDAKTTFV